MGAVWVNALSVQKITEIHLDECILRRCQKTRASENLFLIYQAASKAAIRMNIFEAENRVWSLHRDYLSGMEHARYEEIPEMKTHIAIQHIMSTFRPHYHKTRMDNTVLWNNNVQFDKQDISGFMREIAKQAKKCNNNVDYQGRSQNSGGRCKKEWGYANTRLK